MSVTPSAAAAELLRRRQARRSLADFTAYTMPSYEAAWHHRLLCQKLDAFAAGEIKRLMVFMPPRHGKSEAVSRRLPAYLLGRNPDAQLIACSYSSDLAGRMNRDVQRIIDSPQYARLFPETRLSGKNVRSDATGSFLRNSDLFEVVDRAGSYRAAGIGGGIVGMGFNFGIIDDYFKSRKEADSPTIRQSVIEWYDSAFYTRRAQDAGILICATRWHAEDLCGTLLHRAAEDPKADQWEVLSLPAICVEERRHPEDPRKNGEALWPERFPVEELEKTRASSLYEWSSQYQQEPSPQGSVEWDPELFGASIWFDEWPDNLICRAMALDPSKGKSDKLGDYSAFVMLGVDRSATLWVDADLCNVRPVEPMKSKPGPSILEDGIAHALAFRPQGFVIETNGFQEMVASLFLKESNARNLALPLFTVCNTDPKPQRIRSLGPYFAQGRLRVRKNKGGRLLVQQLKQFPSGEHDDGPDALKMAEVMADYLLRGNASESNVKLLRA